MLLPRGQWSAHQQKFKVWVKANPPAEPIIPDDEETFTDAVMAATMQERTPTLSHPRAEHHIPEEIDTTAEGTFVIARLVFFFC